MIFALLLYNPIFIIKTVAYIYHKVSQRCQILKDLISFICNNVLSYLTFANNSIYPKTDSLRDLELTWLLDQINLL